MLTIILIVIVTVALFAGPRLADYFGAGRALGLVAVVGALVVVAL